MPHPSVILYRSTCLQFSVIIWHHQLVPSVGKFSKKFSNQIMLTSPCYLLLPSKMTSSLEKTNGVQNPLVTVKTPTSDESLLAGLAKNIETLIHKFDTIQPPSSPLHSHTLSPLHKDSVETYFYQPTTTGRWQATLHEQMVGQAEQIQLLEKKLEKVDSSKTNGFLFPRHIGSSPFYI